MFKWLLSGITAACIGLLAVTLASAVTYAQNASEPAAWAPQKYTTLPDGQIATIPAGWTETQVREANGFKGYEVLDVDGRTAIPDGYRVVQLRRGNRGGVLTHPLYLMAFGPGWTDDQIQGQYIVDPNGMHPDFSIYKWGILAVAVALFLGVDVLANVLKPLPPAKRWKPTMYVGILAGGGLVAMQSTYRWVGISGQKAVDLTFQPLAAGIGSIMPVLFGSFAIWFFVRWRAFKTLAKEPSGPPESASPSHLVPRFLAQSDAPGKAPDPFDIAGNEVLSGTVKAGLWARALVEGGENESAVRAAYVRLRVADLQRTTRQGN